MTASPLTTYTDRAGIRTIRELSELTGISRSSVERILKNPEIARGYQLIAIGDVCGMSAEELVAVIKRKEKRRK